MADDSERQETRKAMAYDLHKILDKDPSQETYTKSEIKKMIDVYVVTASAEFRELERLREKASHDEAQALHHAEQKGMQKGKFEERSAIARNLLKINLPMDQISIVTGLSAEEIARLRKGL